MNRKLLIFITTAILINTSCNSAQSLKREKVEQKVVASYLSGSSSNTLESQNDPNNLKGCPILIEQGDWRQTSSGKKIVTYTWGKRMVWLMANGWEIRRGVSIDAYPEIKSYHFPSHPENKNSHLVYIGPWKHIEELQKNIRLIGYQGKNPNRKSTGIRYDYESMDERNKKIPEMTLKLVQKTYDFDELCNIKWIAKYGYNAIAENTKELEPGFWPWLLRIRYTVLTGRIIDSETGKVINPKTYKKLEPK